MPVTSRPFKTWYRVRCVVCGTHFTTHRFHAQFHSPTCRQRYHRNGKKPYTRQVAIIGRGRTNPLAPKSVEPVSVLNTAPQTFEGLLDDYERLAPAVDHGDLVDRELFAEGFDRAPAPKPGTTSAELKPTVTDYGPARAVAGDVGKVDMHLTRQLDALGLDGIPVDRKSYEVARKRVYNLLKAKGRVEGTKRYLKACWLGVQAEYHLVTARS